METAFNLRLNNHRKEINTQMQFYYASNVKLPILTSNYTQNLLV